MVAMIQIKRQNYVFEKMCFTQTINIIKAHNKNKILMICQKLDIEPKPFLKVLSVVNIKFWFKLADK